MPMTNMSKNILVQSMVITTLEILATGMRTAISTWCQEKTMSSIQQAIDYRLD